MRTDDDYGAIPLIRVNSNFYLYKSVFYIDTCIYIGKHAQIVHQREGPRIGFVLSAEVLFLNPEERRRQVLCCKVDRERGWVKAER